MQAGLTARGYDNSSHGFKKVPLLPICQNQGCVNLRKAPPNEDDDELFVGKESALSFAHDSLQNTRSDESSYASLDLAVRKFTTQA